MNDALYYYCLSIGDTSLVHAQRLAEWCGHGPILEEDIALTNISLDLFGQATAFLKYAAEVEGKGRTEDDLAFLRNEIDFRNVLLSEQPNGDYAQTILKCLMIGTWQKHLYEALSGTRDKQLAALAAKSLKEVYYHVRHATEWIKRFAGGTNESMQRIRQAIDELWPYTDDLFVSDNYVKTISSNQKGIDFSTLRKGWLHDIETVFTQAGLSIPNGVFMISRANRVFHTEHLGHLLSVMQALPRAYPGSLW